MTIFNDEHRTVEISIRTWDETRGQWSADWSGDFYDAVAKDVTDVQYCIDGPRTCGTARAITRRPGPGRAWT